MPACRASCGLRKWISRPSRNTWPESGIRAPVSALINVDLPAPLSPITASTSPGNRSTSTPSRPITLPKVLISPRAESTVVVGSASSPAGPRYFSSVVELISDLDLSNPLVDRDRDDDEHADGQHAQLVVHARQAQTDVERVHDQCSKHGAEDSTAPTEQAGSADHDRGDGLQVGGDDG